MKAYKVSTVVTDGEGNEQTKVQYAGTQADARAKRDAMVEKYHVNKKQVKIDDAEIPTSPKEALLDFINNDLLGG